MDARRTRRASALACVLLAAGLAAALCLTSCAGGGAKAAESSPHAEQGLASVTSSSQLTEESQTVDVTIPFDAPVSLADADGATAAADLNATLDGEPLNPKTTRVQLSTQGNNLHVVLSPTPEAQGVDTPLYFACYQGDLSIAAAAEDGSLPHVAGQDGAAAVLDRPVKLTIPSGMRIAQISSQPGQTIVQVEQFAQIRCCTWFDVGTTRLFMHHHRFAQESNRTCAEAMAEAITNGCDGAYSARAESENVIVTSADPNETFDVKIVEGAAA